MIRLDENDYEYLYPHFTPDEIKAIFGDYAHSSRQIYRIYKNMFKLTPMKARKEIEDVAHMCLADGEKSYSENFERTAYMTVLIRKNKIEEVWKKIKQREEINVYRDCEGKS